MNYIKDNDMFTIVYVNKETIEIKQDYLYELEDKTTIDNQLKKEHLKENLYKSLETLTVITSFFSCVSILKILLSYLFYKHILFTIINFHKSKNLFILI